MQKQFVSHLQAWWVSKISETTWSFLTWLPYTCLLAYMYAQNLLRGERWDMNKPYVYRQFLPLTVGLIIRLTHLPHDAALVLVLVLCAVGFAIVSYYSFLTFHEEY